jgi:hypothetical protein
MGKWGEVMDNSDFPNDDAFLDTVIEIAHPFEIDLKSVVTVNLDLTLQAIDELQVQQTSTISAVFEPEDYETAESTIRWEGHFYDDLRRAAIQLALVGLVTRLQHWINALVKQQKVPVTKKHDSLLISQLGALNAALGDAGPVPLAFFEELVTVRDSVIHADSSLEWVHGKTTRRVADCYTDVWKRLEITGDQLKDAARKAIEQVKWYDYTLAARRLKATSKPQDT